MKILKLIYEFIKDIGIRILMLCCLPLIWWMQFSRWIHEKIWGSD